MPRVSRVQWPAMKLDYGFMFHIQTIEELTDYWETVRVGSMAKGLAEAVKSVQGGAHVTTGDGALAEMHLTCGTSVLTAAGKFGEIFEQMAQTLRNEGELFLNIHGGYFHVIKGMKVTDTRTVKDYTLPAVETKKAVISITQWPDGDHFYARVDGQDIEWAGRRKWDSREEAQDCAKKWARERGLHV